MDAEFRSLPYWQGLQEEALAALWPHVTRHDLAEGSRIISEGDAATGMYFLARGVVRVEHGGEALTTINAPTLFGEMALVATTPRLASVVSNRDVLVYEVSRDAIFSIASSYPSVRDVILGFHRDRLMQNVLAANALFAPISDANKSAMAAHFVSAPVPAGEVLLQEGAEGKGLYVLLRGQCDVFRNNEGESIKVGELHEGDVFGEISIVLFDRPCTATVKSVTDCVTLFLGREVFQRTIMSHPEAREAVVKLALARLNQADQAASGGTKAFFV